MQIPLQEPDALSGIPEYLRLVAKPVVDLIMAGTDPSTYPKNQLLANGGGIIQRDIAFIQGELGACSCSKAPNRKDEPYASLSKLLPADIKFENRKLVLDRGHGLTLFDIARIQQTLGTCSCEGRRKAIALPNQPQQL